LLTKVKNNIKSEKFLDNKLKLMTHNKANNPKLQLKNERKIPKKPQKALSQTVIQRFLVKKDFIE